MIEGSSAAEGFGDGARLRAQRLAGAGEGVLSEIGAEADDPDEGDDLAVEAVDRGGVDAAVVFPRRDGAVWPA
ncbi:MAG TPA: hypothetical protein VFQ25_16570 [Ktedonobacterales bacterium]|nr:hypothetical protein [Ktedonobacterales bacterium]